MIDSLGLLLAAHHHQQGAGTSCQDGQKTKGDERYDDLPETPFEGAAAEVNS
jgi:hypothetical protein